MIDLSRNVSGIRASWIDTSAVSAGLEQLDWSREGDDLVKVQTKNTAELPYCVWASLAAVVAAHDQF